MKPIFKNFVKSFGLSSILLFFCLTHTNAQDCKNYYYMINNAEVQMTLYDNNGTTSGIQTWKISGVKKNGNGFQSSVVSTMTDAKGAEIAKGAGVYKCDGGRLMADMRMSLPQDGAKQIEAGDAKFEGSSLDYPVNISEGMSLPDALFTMNATTTGIPSTTQFEIKNRKVAGLEKITSAAGSWDAYKITYDAVMKIKMGGIGIPMNMKTTEWFVPNFGIVKTETFNKKGKLVGSSLLTKLKK